MLWKTTTWILFIILSNVISITTNYINNYKKAIKNIVILILFIYIYIYIYIGHVKRVLMCQNSYNSIGW